VVLTAISLNREIVFKKLRTKLPHSDGFETLSVRNIPVPSLPLAEERVNERSDVRVSQPGGHYRQCIYANVRRVDSPELRTYGASLAHPFFRKQKRRKLQLFFMFRTLKVSNPSTMGYVALSFKSVCPEFSKVFFVFCLK